MLDKVLIALNRVAATDPYAIDRLLSHRVSINAELVNDPDLPCHGDAGSETISGLALANCVLNALGLGPVVCHTDEDGEIYFRAREGGKPV